MKRPHAKLNKVAEFKITSMAEIEGYFDKIIPLLEARALTPEDDYWLTETNEDYCLKCIKASKSDFDWKMDYGEYFDGGFRTESDTVRTCEKCGALLDYELTDYGVDSELEHFLEHGFDWNYAGNCFEVLAVACGVYSDAQKRKLYRILRNSTNKPDTAPPHTAAGDAPDTAQGE